MPHASLAERKAYKKRYWALNRERLNARAKQRYALRDKKEVRAKQRAWVHANKEHYNDYQRRYYAKNHELKKQQARKRYRANLEASRQKSRDQYAKNRELGKTGRKGHPVATRKSPPHCECCGRSATAGKRRLAIDHCHLTRRFRGWLCGQCNVGIGMLGDTLEGVSRAVDYLKRTNNG